MSSRDGHEEDSGGGGHGGASSDRWLLTYSDMITLLMVFFIVLYAASEVNKEQFARVAQSLRQSFGGGNMVVNTGGVGDGANVPLQEISKSVDLGQVHLQRQDPLVAIGEQLKADFERDGRFTVWVSERGLTISLVGSAAFDSGKADLKPEFLSLLSTIADKIKDIPNDIAVEGSTDSDPIHTAAYPSNWYLSTARANQVRDYLEIKGVDLDRMIVVGYGESRAIASNDTAEGKAKNRRVDIVILRNKVIVDLGKEISPDKP